LYKIQEYELALKVYEEYSMLGNIEEEKRQYSLMHIADIYLRMKNFDKAAYFVKKGLEVITIGSAYREQLLYQYATISFSKGEYHKALSISEKLLKEDIKDDLTKAGIYILIIIVSYTIQDIQKARKYLLMWSENSPSKEEDFLNLRNLIKSIAICQQPIWKTELPFIFKIISELQELEHLSKALISLIDYFVNDIKDITQFRNWQLLWEEIGEGYEYLQPALKALKATRLAVEEKTDKPLFALPKEIRELVLPMVEDAIKK
jgi:tetratricopeptide (TPR) repeat protein